jgi:hypothetical protein
MITSDTISALTTDALQAVINKAGEVFADQTFDEVETRFVDYINGPGAYDDFTSWRQAWRSFVEFCTDDEAAHVGFINAPVPAALLSKENQLALF